MSHRSRGGIAVAHGSFGSVPMLMFKRSQLYIALALAGLAEILVAAAMR